jgi:nitrous oxidase accessory protein
MKRASSALSRIASLAAGALVLSAVQAAFAGGARPALDLQKVIQVAPTGATVRVPAGTYAAPLLIDKPLTLIGDPHAILAGDGTGHVVIIHSDRVTLRGFEIRGTGQSLDQEHAAVSAQGTGIIIENNTIRDALFGIYLRSSPGAIIRGNDVGGKSLDLGRRGDGIRLWQCPDSRIDHNRVHGSRDVIMWFSDRVRVLDNAVTASRYGLHFMYSSGDLVEGNVLEDNSVGVYMMYSRDLTLRNNQLLRNRGPSGYGIGLKNVDGLDARDNFINGNRVGLYIDDSPARLDVHHTFTRNTFLVNDIGIAFLPNVRRNTFTGNNFIDNFEQVAILGGGSLQDDHFSTAGQGNFWSDYRGYDRQGRGTGDLPYRPENLFENLMDRQPRLRLFLFSPAQQAVQLAAQAFPVFKPASKLVDEHPLMQPAGAIASVAPSKNNWILTSIAMGALTLLGFHRRRTASIQSQRNDFGGPTIPGETLSAQVPALPAAPNHPAPVSLPRSGRTVLRVGKLTKSFGSFKAVDDLSFEVMPAEAMAIWGCNGAGKTTAIKCILGLLRCHGEIQVCGHTLAHDPKAFRRAIGYVPQEVHLYDDLTVTQALRFFARIKKVPFSRIDAILHEVGLVEHARKSTRALSGGMKQRLALGIALLADPPLLLLDEMTASLDAAARHGFLRLLNQQKHAGKAIVFITHRLDEVEALADRVLVLQQGLNIGCCAREDLCAQLGLQTRIKLILSAEHLEAALAALKQDGHTASRNGRGIYVDVPSNRKADPLRDLLARGFAVDDFELDEASLSVSQPKDRSPHGTL